jgi:hypothetical protein
MRDMPHTFLLVKRVHLFACHDEQLARCVVSEWNWQYARINVLVVVAATAVGLCFWSGWWSTRTERSGCAGTTKRLEQQR